MSTIRAEAIKELRQRTGAGMMDCKKALVELNGDMDKALQYLREKGLSDASKKAGRMTSEGLVYACVGPDGRVGAMVEVNCETDFVAKNPTFKAFVREAARRIAEDNPTDLDAFDNLTLTDGRSLDETVKALVNTFGENIVIRRFVRFEAEPLGAVSTYVHDDYLTEGKIGVLLVCMVSEPETLSNPEFHADVKALAIHIAAAGPTYIRRDDVPVEILEREKSIYRTQAIGEGKSEDIADRILQGRIERFYKDVCLLDQDFVKNPSQTVANVLEEMNAKFGGENICIVRFARFEKGGGD